MLLAVLSIIGTAVVVIGIPTTILQARSAIREGRRQQADHDKQLHDDGYAAGVASVQAQLYDLKNQVTTLTDDRNYWRGLRGEGHDHRTQGGGDGRN